MLFIFSGAFNPSDFVITSHKRISTTSCKPTYFIKYTWKVYFINIMGYIQFLLSRVWGGLKGARIIFHLTNFNNSLKEMGHNESQAKVLNQIWVWASASSITNYVTCPLCLHQFSPLLHGENNNSIHLIGLLRELNSVKMTVLSLVWAHSKSSHPSIGNLRMELKRQGGNEWRREERQH